MKINGSVPISGATGKYRDAGRVNSTQGTGSLGSDKVEFSASAKSFAAALKAVKDAPDVRPALVNEIKTKIDNGTYVINNMSTANAMIRKINF